MYRRAPDAALSATSLPRADGLAKPPRRSTAGRAELAPAADRGALTTTIGKKKRAPGQSAFRVETQKSLDSDDSLDYPLVDAVARRTRRRCMDAADSSRAAADARGAGMGSAGAAGQ